MVTVFKTYIDHYSLELNIYTMQSETRLSPTLFMMKTHISEKMMLFFFPPKVSFWKTTFLVWIQLMYITLQTSFPNLEMFWPENEG